MTEGGATGSVTETLIHIALYSGAETASSYDRKKKVKRNTILGRNYEIWPHFDHIMISEGKITAVFFIWRGKKIK